MHANLYDSHASPAEGITSQEHQRDCLAQRLLATSGAGDSVAHRSPHDPAESISVLVYLVS